MATPSECQLDFGCETGQTRGGAHLTTERVAWQASGPFIHVKALKRVGACVMAGLHDTVVLGVDSAVFVTAKTERVHVQVVHRLGSLGSQMGSRDGDRSMHGRQTPRRATAPGANNRTHVRARAVGEGNTCISGNESTSGASGSLDSGDRDVSVVAEGLCPEIQVTGIHVKWHESTDVARSYRSRPRLGAVAEGWSAAWKFGVKTHGGGYYDEEGEKTVHGCVYVFM